MKAIRFQVTKRGKLRAYRWRGEYFGRAAPDTIGRWFPMPAEEAKLAIATGAAYEYNRPLVGTTPDDVSTN